MKVDSKIGNIIILILLIVCAAAFVNARRDWNERQEHPKPSPTVIVSFQHIS